MRQATGLRGNLVGVDEAMQSRQDRADCFHRIGSWVHADDGVSAAVEQAFESREKNSAEVIGGMIGLSADAEHSTLTHGIAAAGDVADLSSRKDEVLVAHEFGHGGGDFGDDGFLQGMK